MALLHCLLHRSFISFTAPAGSPRKVHVSNYTSPYSLLVTWQEIHPAAQNGVILGYRVLYTLVLVSRQTEITTDIEEITVQAPTKNVLLTGLSSFSLYKIEVLGFNDVGDGPLSSPVFAGGLRWSILDRFACASLFKEPLI